MQRCIEAERVMGRIPWGTRMWVLPGANSSSFVGVLAKLLSNNWLVERHLDTLGSYLNFRADNDRKHAGGCWVGDVYFSACLKKVYRKPKTVISADCDLNKYKETITEHHYKCLLFPVNLNNNHWIAFSVDLEKKEFRFGVPSYFSRYGYMFAHHHSMRPRRLTRQSKPQHRTVANTSWAGKSLSVVFGATFEDLGNTLPIGQQEDSYSCGICVVNTMEHMMFGAPLFTDRDRYCLRVQYFLEAVKYLLNDVRILFQCMGRNCTHICFPSLLNLCVKVLLNRLTMAKEPAR